MFVRSLLLKTRTPTRAIAYRPSPLRELAPNILHPLAVFTNHKQGLEACFRSWVLDSDEKALMVNDLGIAERQFNRWTTQLPQVQPFYAVKCNPDPIFLSALAGWGSNFDCASRAEIQRVLDNGVDPSRIIFANPIKSPADLKFAHSVGVTRMTFDNLDEVIKVKQYCPRAQLVLRLLPDDSGSVMRFGSKFGAPSETIETLLRTCQQHKIAVIGVSFHIGSGCFDPSKYDDAIGLCRKAFNIAERIGMPQMHLVDIGGGFPGDIGETAVESIAPAGQTAPPFEDIALVIRSAFCRHFPEDMYPNLVRIGEPGRYFGTAFSTLFLRVHGKRETYSLGNDEKHKRFLYYVNDGVYGSFNCKMYDYYHPVPISTRCFFGTMDGNENQRPTTLGTFFGPTCDSLDRIIDDHPIPELNVGDSIVFTNMGAYTTAAASEFNGFPLPQQTYMYSSG